MPYAITMLKVNTNQTDSVQNNLIKIGDLDAVKKINVTFELIISTFGWSDFLLVIKGDKLEHIKESVVIIRKYLSEKGVEVETSTIVGLSLSELKAARARISHDPSF